MENLDGYFKSSEVARARGWSTRWLYAKIQVGEFPPPDRPATKRGEPNLWRASTVKRALDEMQNAAAS